ncbi:hypothetical protein SB861_15235 [Paraburkholderia sp. SIMBA_049]
MKHFLRVLAALLMTVPVCMALSKIGPLAQWVYNDSTWNALRPLFDLVGSIGVEGDEDVVVALLLIASFLISWAIAWIGSLLFSRIWRRSSVE